MSIAFDLVLATVGRTDELARFLDSVQVQSHDRFRVIVIDQNGDDRLAPLISRYAGVPLLHLRCERGLSRSRNLGLAHVEGDVVCFPDDDCRYPVELLANVAAALDDHPEWDGVSGRTIDDSGRSSFVRWQKAASFINRRNVWRTGVSTAVFLRRSLVERVGMFDESLGVGAGTRWGSGEETDYLLRALALGATLRYDPSLTVLHESATPTADLPRTEHAYRTGLGNSRVLRLHAYSWWFALYRFLQLAGGSMVFLASGRPTLARYYWAMARGRAVGWMQR